MDNAGKLATYGKQYENTTQYVLDTYTQTNTNKTQASPQTMEGKD
jgi:hypothetical protein